MQTVIIKIFCCLFIECFVIFYSFIFDVLTSHLFSKTGYLLPGFSQENYSQLVHKAMP